MRFLRDSSLTIASQLLGTLIGVASSILVARAFGPEGRGLYALLLLSIMATALVTNLGLGPAAVFFIGQRQSSSQASAGLLILASLAIGAFVAAVLIAVTAWSGSANIGGIPTVYWLVIAALAPFSLAKRYASYMFIAVSDFVWYNYLNILELGTRFVVILSIFLVFRAGPNTIVVGTVFGIVTPTLLAWFRIVRQTGGLRFRIESILVRKFTIYGIRFYLAELVPFLSLRFDQYLVGSFLGVADVGLYAAGVSLAEILRTVALAAAAVLFGRVASLDRAAATDLAGVTSRVSMTLSIFGAVFLIVFGKEILQVMYGSRFIAAAPVFRLLLPGVIANNLYEILYADLAGRGKPEIGMCARLSGLCLIVVGDSLIIPRWGILGAALVASVAQVVSGFVLMVLYVRFTHQKLRRILWVTRGDLSAIWSLVKGLLSDGRLAARSGGSRDDG